jgi:hypothetical protein
MKYPELVLGILGFKVAFFALWLFSIAAFEPHGWLWFNFTTFVYASGTHTSIMCTPFFDIIHGHRVGLTTAA